MNVHIFEKVDYPCVCDWLLKKTASDIISLFNEKDDHIDSSESLEEAISTSTGVCKILANSGLKLTKWSSNASQIIKIFSESELSPNHKNWDLTETTIEGVLGVLWNSEKDALQIKVVQKAIQSNKTWNPEFFSSIFESLGLLTPFLLRLNLIVQDPWWFVGPDFLCNEGGPIDSKSTKHEINAEIGSCVKEVKNYHKTLATWRKMI